MTETHPFPPFLPTGARVLIMGTFPPQPKRWAMDFYYPNPSNDFWRIMGLLLLGDSEALCDRATHTYRLPLIISTMERAGIALHDTAREVRRLRDNASDKFLDIITPVPLWQLLERIPACRTLATTGEKAAGVLAHITSTLPPPMGQCIHDSVHGLDLWRMPSTSRAYPLPLQDKAAHYARLLRSADIIN